MAFSCGTLPAHVSCTFAPPSVTIASGSAPVTDTLTINTAVTTTAMHSAPLTGAATDGFVVASVLWLPGLLTLAGLFRRKGKHFSTRRLTLFGVLCLAIVGLGCMTGCGGGSSSASNAAKPGTYAVPLTITLAEGATQNVSISIVVQ